MGDGLIMNFSEFRKLTMPEQKTYPGRHPVFRAWVIYAMQLPASPFSYILAKGKVSANQISILRVVLYLGILPLFLLSNKVIIFGIVIYYFALISDCIDGQLARYHGTGSLEGSFVDSITSVVMVPSMFIAAGLTVYNWSGGIWGLLLISLLLGLRGISERTKNSVIMKHLFSESASLSVYDRKDNDTTDDSQAKKRVGYLKVDNNLIVLLLMDNHFLLLRIVFAIVLGMLLNNNPIIIYLLLLGTLFITVRLEIVTSWHIFRDRGITKFINRYLPLFLR